MLAYGVAEVPVGHDACVPSPWEFRTVTTRSGHGAASSSERWEGEVDLSENRGRVELVIPLERAWTARGALAADLHVHAHASNDSTMPNPQRVIAQVAAGIQVIGLSDHNANGDLDAEITQLHLDDTVASIASNELTAEGLHVGVYPVIVDRTKPNGGAPPAASIIHGTPKQVFDIARAFPNHPIVQLNHPRFKYDALYDGTGWDGVKWPPPFPLEFDAVEVVAGYSAFNIPGDRRFDDSARDLYTLYDHGHLVTPMGNSDTHDLNWVLDGTTRTSYVYVDDPRTQPFDEDGFIAAIRASPSSSTSGPWLDVEVASKQGATPTVGPGQAIIPDHGARSGSTSRSRKRAGCTSSGSGSTSARSTPAGAKRSTSRRTCAAFTGPAASTSVPPTRSSGSPPTAIPRDAAPAHRHVSEGAREAPGRDAIRDRLAGARRRRRRWPVEARRRGRAAAVTQRVELAANGSR